MLTDSPVHSEPIDRGFNPRPTPTMTERRFPGAPGPSFGSQYGGGDGSGPPFQMYGDPTGMQGHYPSYPPQPQMMNVAQPAYPDPSTYASPIALAPAALPPRAPSALDNPYDNATLFDASNPGSPYMATPPTHFSQDFGGGQSIDYVTLSRSGPSTPVTPSPFESPAFFAPVAADVADPLYPALQLSKSRQNSLEPPTALASVAAAEMPPRASSEFHDRPSEDYARAAAMTLPVRNNAADEYGVQFSAMRQDTLQLQDPTRPDTVYAL
jgi:hypothetical protein